MNSLCKSSITAALLSLLLVEGVNAQTSYQTVDTERLHSMVVDNAYKLEGGQPTENTVIDTRTPEKYRQGHIFSAINIQVCDLPLQSLMLPQDPGAPIVLYGDDNQIGDTRVFLTLLTQAGFTNIRIYPEPFSVWKGKHLPVVEPKTETP